MVPEKVGEAELSKKPEKKTVGPKYPGGYTPAEEQEIYRRALILWGKHAQIDQLREEMDELGVALNHYLRNPDRVNTYEVMAELADVENMIGQIKLIFGEVKAQRTGKLARLEVRLNAGEARKRAETSTTLTVNHPEVHILNRS
jgi:hypothetical protein